MSIGTKVFIEQNLMKEVHRLHNVPKKDKESLFEL